MLIGKGLSKVRSVIKLLSHLLRGADLLAVEAVLSYSSRGLAGR